VQYYIIAVDATNDSTDANAAPRGFYYVRDNGLTIFDVQYTPFANGNSGYTNAVVTVEGVATTDSADFGYYYIQNGRDPWNGIWVNDNVNNVRIGDRVRVTGTVQENFNVTRIGSVTNATILSSGNPVPEPILLQTGVLAAPATAEQYEGMLVRVRSVKVTNPFPDSPSNFGEFSVTDGSGEMRVDDESASFIGNLDSSYVQGDSLISITGIHFFSFSNYKMLPRNDADVVRYIPTAVDESPGSVPLTYGLEQNYPNPFNPETTIEFTIPVTQNVRLELFNTLGERVVTVVDGNLPAGAHAYRFDGRNLASGIYYYRIEAGNFHRTRKMILLR